MLNNNKKIILKKTDNNENKKVVFKNSKKNSLIIYEEEDVYIFDIETFLYTNDVLEAVSYLIKNKEYVNEKFWNLELKDNMIDYIVPTNSLYWLSGGDNFWNDWSIKWSENHELFEKKFKNKLIDILHESSTMKELKQNLMKNFNLDVFYEFALLSKLKKEKL